MNRQNPAAASRRVWRGLPSRFAGRPTFFHPRHSASDTGERRGAAIARAGSLPSRPESMQGCARRARVRGARGPFPVRCPARGAAAHPAPPPLRAPTLNPAGKETEKQRRNDASENGGATGENTQKPLQHTRISPFPSTENRRRSCAGRTALVVWNQSGHPEPGASFGTSPPTEFSSEPRWDPEQSGMGSAEAAGAARKSGENSTADHPGLLSVRRKPFLFFQLPFFERFFFPGNDAFPKHCHVTPYLYVRIRFRRPS